MLSHTLYERFGYIRPILTDTLGALLAEELQGSSVEVLAERGSEPMPLAVVSLQRGTPSYQFYRENTAERNVTLGGLNQATPNSMKALYEGSLALSGGMDADVRAAFIYNRAEYMNRLDRVLAHTGLLKLSDEDLEWLMPDAPIEEAARALAARSSTKIVIVMLGDKGAFALIGTRKSSPLPRNLLGF